VVDRDHSGYQQPTRRPPEFTPVVRKPRGVTVRDVPGTIQVHVAVVGTIDRHWESHFNDAQLSTTEPVQNARIRGNTIVATVAEDQVERWPTTLDHLLQAANDRYVRITLPELTRLYLQAGADSQEGGAERTARLQEIERRLNEEG